MNFAIEYKGKRTYISFTKQGDILAHGTIIGAVRKEGKEWRAESHEIHGISALGPNREIAVKEMINRVEWERRARGEKEEKEEKEEKHINVSFDQAIEEAQKTLQRKDCPYLELSWRGGSHWSASAGFVSIEGASAAGCTPGEAISKAIALLNKRMDRKEAAN